MKITCESCGAKYTIADDKVVGRKVKIRCKGCSTPIVVDGQKLGPSGAPPSDSKAETLLPQPPPDWSVNLSETDQRSMTTQQVVEAYQSGVLTPEAYVWREGMADWIPLLESAELAPLLVPSAGAEAAVAPPPPGYGEAGAIEPNPEARSEGSAPIHAAFPPPASSAEVTAAQEPSAPEAGASGEPETPNAPKAASSPVAAVPPPEPTATPTPLDVKTSVGAERGTARAVRARSGSLAKTEAGSVARSSASARVTGGRSQGAHDLFAGVETAGAEALDMPITGPSLPQAGSTAYADDRPTGARNENSVLFSLDSMKAANLAPQAKDAQTADPFGMGGSSGMAGLGGGNPLFTLADNQRLLTAPPPPPEPPPRPVAVAVPSAQPGSGLVISRKMLGIIAGGLLLILLLGIGIGAALSGDDEKEQATAASASADANSAPVAAKEEPKGESEPEKKDEPAGSDVPPAASVAEKGDSAEKPAEPSKSPGGKSASGAAKKEKKEDAPAPAADQPFNRGAAVAAMSAAASQAASCKKAGGPRGSGKASLTFAPTGRVTAATVDTAPFAGTAVGGCVASVFRRAKVPPFTGNPIRVSKSFTIP